MMLFLVISLASIVILYLFVGRNKSDLDTIPALSLVQLIKFVASNSSTDPIEKIMELHGLFGPIFKIHIRPFKPVIFTTKEECIDKILMSKDHLEKSFVYQVYEPYIGQGLASARSINEWKIDRKLCNYAMGHSFLTKFLSKTDSYVSKFCDTVKNRYLNKPIDIQTHMHDLLIKVILETISHSSISLDWDAINHYSESRARFCELAMERMLSIYLVPDAVHKYSANYADTQKVCNVLNLFASDLLNQHKRIQEPISDNYNLIQTLIDGGMSDAKIIDNINTIIEGGHDSSALTTTWMAYELSRNKVVQENILKEAIDVLGSDAQKVVTLKDIQEMKYIDRFVTEILRRYTIFNLLVRKAGTSVHINKVEIPEGSLIIFAPHAIHMSEEYYDDPTVFDPDRFLPEHRVKLNPNTYVPFSLGTRNCIAKTIAVHQLKLIVAKLVLAFEIKPYEHEMEIVTIPARKSKNGVFVVLNSRETK